MPPSPDLLPNSTAQIELGERALAELGPKLTALADLSVVRPSTDPQGAAATALLVGDYLAQPELQANLPKVGMTPALVVELQSIARAMVTVVLRLGGDYLPDSPSIPGDLVQKGQAVRAAVATALEKALPDDAELQVWLEAVRLGAGVVDLVYDLRTLAERCAFHSAESDASAAAKATAGSIQPALSAADAIEFALRTGDPPETAHARDALARLWTIFLPAYDRAAAAAQALTKDEGQVRTFPALALVASHRRARRRPLSVMPSRAPVARSTPPKRPSVGMPAAVAIIDAEDVAEVIAEVPLPRTASAPPADRAGWTDTRRADRHSIEIEVGVASESNFYLGFTENLSSGGVFVATYVIKPLGSPVEVTLSFPNGEQLKVHGVVRWQRDATPDAWPGMGVQFESLSPEDEAKVRKFLSLREPMFYDE